MSLFAQHFIDHETTLHTFSPLILRLCVCEVANGQYCPYFVFEEAKDLMDLSRLISHLYHTLITAAGLPTRLLLFTFLSQTMYPGNSKCLNYSPVIPTLLSLQLKNVPSLQNTPSSNIHLPFEVSLKGRESFIWPLGLKYPSCTTTGSCMSPKIALISSDCNHLFKGLPFPLCFKLHEGRNHAQCWKQYLL